MKKVLFFDIDGVSFILFKHILSGIPGKPAPVPTSIIEIPSFIYDGASSKNDLIIVKRFWSYWSDNRFSSEIIDFLLAKPVSRIFWILCSY